MSDSKEPFEIIAERFSLKRLYPDDRMFTGSSKPSDGSYGKPADPNALPKPEEPIELAADTCEFAVGKCFRGSENRVCVCGSFCPTKVFKDPKVFLTCHNRIEKLAEQT
jgi:hypothetical protein